MALAFQTTFENIILCSFTIISLSFSPAHGFLKAYVIRNFSPFRMCVHIKIYIYTYLAPSRVRTILFHCARRISYNYCNTLTVRRDLFGTHPHPRAYLCRIQDTYYFETVVSIVISVRLYLRNCSAAKHVSARVRKIVENTR